MAISPETKVFAPLSGTVVQRKIGPGQYIAAGSGDPVLMIGDLSSVWLAAYVRESDADKVKVGQPVKFSVLAQPGRVFEAQIKYVDASIDPTSRRRMVRAEIPNTDGLLTPEMFATAKIDIGEDVSTPAVPTVKYDDKGKPRMCGRSMQIALSSCCRSASAPATIVRSRCSLGCDLVRK